MIEIKNLVKRYGDFAAVNDISFTIEDGEIVGFLGPNGAGKTTTMSILTGCLSMTSGSVTINGIDIFDQPLEAKKEIGSCHRSQHYKTVSQFQPFFHNYSFPP